MEITKNNEPIDIISLRRKHNSCEHGKISVDISENEIVCDLCGERINPIWWLSQWANKEGMYKTRLNELKQCIAETEDEEKVKNRCKCEHCGKMTKINKRGY